MDHVQGDWMFDIGYCRVYSFLNIYPILVCYIGTICVYLIDLPPSLLLLLFRTHHPFCMPSHNYHVHLYRLHSEWFRTTGRPIAANIGAYSL